MKRHSPAYIHLPTEHRHIYIFIYNTQMHRLRVRRYLDFIISIIQLYGCYEFVFVWASERAMHSFIWIAMQKVMSLPLNWASKRIHAQQPQLISPPPHAQFSGRKIYFANIWKTYLQFIIIIEQESEYILGPSSLCCRHRLPFTENLFVRSACTNRGLLIITHSAMPLNGRPQQQQHQHQHHTISASDTFAPPFEYHLRLS